MFGSLLGAGLGFMAGGPMGAMVGMGMGGGIDANRANRHLAKGNQAFQERMSSTAYQRATRDMRKAGLNPMLAYQQGGASTTSGSLAQMENVAEGVSANALEMAMLKANKANVMKDTKLKETQKEYWDSQKEVNRARTWRERIINKAIEGTLRSGYRKPTLPESMKKVGPGAVRLP